MRKNGFTLIELLAVIVILAIIALIATPIILGIINDARKESQERSVELYASAIRTGIAAYQLREMKEVAAGTYTSETLPFDVEYDGDVECTTIELYEDGGVYVTGCTVNDLEVKYTYGTNQSETPDSEGIPDVEAPPSMQVYKPQYYSWIDSGSVGGDLPSDAKTTVEELNPSYPVYLGFDVDGGNKVTVAYACFVRNKIEYCLKETTDGSAYETNVEIIKAAFADVVDTDSCSFVGDDSRCYADGLLAYLRPYGYVSVSIDNALCDANGLGDFGCYE